MNQAGKAGSNSEEMGEDSKPVKKVELCWVK